MINDRNLKLPLVLKKIREENKLTVREMAKLTGFSSTYVSEAENGCRMATVSYLNSIKNKLILSEEEKKALLFAYNRDRLNINDDLLYYLIDNDLVESLEIIRKFDEQGNEIKKIAKELQNKIR